MILKTSDTEDIKPFLKKLYTPPKDSHKGQNGKVLIIGGSSLFHSASIWAAEIASHIVDMVFYSSVEENNKIFEESKKKFSSGIVVRRADVGSYIQESDVILLGPGMVRGEVNPKFNIQNPTFSEILKIEDEPTSTYYLTKYLLNHYPHKKYVLDAGALQMMDKKWLLSMAVMPLLTPHKGEYEKLFDRESVEISAKKYNSIILHKAIDDSISDGVETYIVQGGNQGLTKGGTGDLLAGLAASLYAKNEGITSAVLASYLLKKTADSLQLTKGYWYNVNDLIEVIPSVLRELQNL